MRLDGTTTLAVFVTSDVPDVYVNILGYCVDHFALGRVVFLGVLEDRGQKDAVQEKLDRLRERVRDQLDALQKGSYLYQDRGTKEWKRRKIEIEPAHQRRYARIATQAVNTQVVVYDELDDELAKLASGRCVFDVTGVLKGLLVDIYAILSAQGVSEVRVFELQLPSRTYDERELIHNLSVDRRDYEYANLTESRYTNGLKIYSGGDEDRIRVQIERVIDTASETLARRGMTLYALLVVTVVLLIVGVVWEKGWDNVEPITFVLFALVPYVITCLLASLGKRSVSFLPRDLLDALRSWERSRLIKAQGANLGLRPLAEPTVAQERHLPSTD